MTLRKKTTNAALWQASARAVDRGLRFGSSLLLVRMLDKEDFGLLAATMVVVAVLESVSYVGTEQAILQSSRAGEARFLGATFRTMVLRGLVLTALALVLAPASAWYFEDPEVAPMVRIVACIPLVTGLANPWLHFARKELRFRELSGALVAGAVLQVAVSVALAAWGAAAFALAWGQVAGAVATTAAGWLLMPRRLDLRRDPEAMRELRANAGRTAGVPFLIMLTQQAPSVILGRIGGLPVLGVYTLAQRLCSLPSEIALPIFGSVLTPAYAALKDDRERLARVWLRTFGVISQVVVPITAAMVVLDEEVPVLFYGPAYEPAPGLVSMLALISLLHAVAACTGPLFWGVGRPEIDRTSLGIRLVAIVLFSTAGAWFGGATAFAGGVAIGLLGAIVYCLVMVRRILATPWIEIGRAFAPAAVLGGATLAVGAGVRLGVRSLDAALGAASGFVLVGSVGLVAVAAVAFAAWRIRRSRA
jgi:O-antigen/teichoic acid export membrane protein